MLVKIYKWQKKKNDQIKIDPRTYQAESEVISVRLGDQLWQIYNPNKIYNPNNT